MLDEGAIPPQRFFRILPILLSCFCAIWASSLSANGGTYGRTVEGIQFTKEPRVAMAKERLFISLDKIRVEYVFRNDTDQEVTTDILFPTGSMDYDPEAYPASEVITGFRVWSEGYSKAVVAEFFSTLNDRQDTSFQPEKDPYYTWGGRDITKLLHPLGLSRVDVTEEDVRKLTPRDLVRLWKHRVTPLIPQERYPSPSAPAKEWLRLASKAIDLGIVSSDVNREDLIKTWKSDPSAFDFPVEPYPQGSAPESEWLAMARRALRSGTYWPNWTVHEMYRWRQVFQPHKEVSIAIEYIPSTLSEDLVSAANGDALYRSLDGHTMPMLDGTRQSVKRLVLAQAAALKLDPDAQVLQLWIDYVMTTANTWKGPIEDFELVVDGGPKTPVALFWPGPVECIGPNRYRVRLKQFKPSKDIKVTFFAFMKYWKYAAQ